MCRTSIYLEIARVAIYKPEFDHTWVALPCCDLNRSRVCWGFRFWVPLDSSVRVRRGVSSLNELKCLSYHSSFQVKTINSLPLLIQFNILKAGIYVIGLCRSLCCVQTKQKSKAFPTSPHFVWLALLSSRELLLALEARLTSLCLLSF